jgi:alpha-mannosidase
MRQTLYYIPHTHWEGAVFKTREEYLDYGLDHILQAMALLKRYPEYKFTLDQVAYFKPFLERYPEEAADFRRFVAEGRLGIVGGMDVMPDTAKPGGELFIRQMQYGKGYCSKELGEDVTAAWLLDTFGHHPQLPQLLRLAGFRSFWFCRGVPNEETPAEFLWRGLDGTEIQAYRVIGYGLFYGPPRDPEGFADAFRQRFDVLDRYTSAPERVGLAGVDVCEPEAYVPPLVEGFNADVDRPFDIRYAVPADFEQIVAKRASMPVLECDLGPIFQGTFSSRAELHQITRATESQLLDAEWLCAVGSLFGRGACEREIWDAWEPLLFNQCHDLCSGVMTDHVYEDVRRGYDISQHLAGNIAADRRQAIAAQIDTSGEGIPIVVFNALSWQRTGPVEFEIAFAQQGVKSVKVVDSGGGSVPYQLDRVGRHEGGGIRAALVTIIARDVPALGYAVYRVSPSSEPDGAEGAASEGSVLEGASCRITVDRATGSITSLFDKRAGCEALGGPANVVAREADHGDLWELYHGLDGGSHIAMTNRQPVPTAETALLSTAEGGDDSSVKRGPVYSEFRVSHPMGNGSFATTIRLYADMARVEIATELVNNEKWVRYQALFPTAVRNGACFQEVPFGAVRRADGIEFPAQRWSDYSDGERGLAVLNAGMPGNLVSGDTLMLSLLRSHNLGAYGYGGGYEPGMSSESGFQLGKRLTFRYAILPHGGDWRAVYREGMEFNRPLIAHKETAHAGALPAWWGLADISPLNVVLSACRPAPNGGIALRVYEASGIAVKGATIRLHGQVVSAHDSDLLEAPGDRLDVKDDVVEIDLRPFEIRTIVVSLAHPR